ncbi:MAG: hypothetical protein FWE34_07845 [Defluviitaleaceae bacterium]|nr:hypothetical protein [Defluviitaleaceae bacterium]
MREGKIKNNIIICVIGVVLVIVGILIAIFYTIPEETMQALPFALGGIGLGVFGGGLGGWISNHLMNKDPKLADEMQLYDSDERNVSISLKAKAKTDTFTSMLLYALVIFLTVMQVQAAVVLVFLGAIALRIIVLFFFLNKYHKEM